MRTGQNYLAWTMVVASGVFLGNLLTAVFWWVIGLAFFNAMISGLSITTGEPPSSAVTRGAIYRQHVADQRLAQRTQVERKIESEKRKAQAEAQSRRRASSQGKQLQKPCAVWSDNYNKTQSKTIRFNRDFYCDRYHRFIDTGQVTLGQPRLQETR